MSQSGTEKSDNRRRARNDVKPLRSRAQKDDKQKSSSTKSSSTHALPTPTNTYPGLQFKHPYTSSTLYTCERIANLPFFLRTPPLKHQTTKRQTAKSQKAKKIKNHETLVWLRHRSHHGPIRVPRRSREWTNSNSVGAGTMSSPFARAHCGVAHGYRVLPYQGQWAVVSRRHRAGSRRIRRYRGFSEAS